MALRPPDAPSLHFKERDGFITGESDEDAESVDESDEDSEVESDDEYSEDDESVDEFDDEFFEGTTEEFFGDDPFESDEEFDDAIESDDEVMDDESVDETVDEVPSEEFIREEVPPPATDRREPSVTVKQPDAGGRSGSALPTASEMAAYADGATRESLVQQNNPTSDRGRAILREFEEEDRLMAEQRESMQTVERDDRSSFIPITPPSGGLKWLLLIAVLTVLGYTVVRQLVMNPIAPSKSNIPTTINPPSKQKKPSTPSKAESIPVQQSIKLSPQAQKAVEAIQRASEKEQLRSKLQQRATKPQSNLQPSKPSKSEPLVEELKPAKPRPPSSVAPKKDDVKHIEIRI